jgi:type IV pilus assembly protein PilW
MIAHTYISGISQASEPPTAPTRASQRGVTLVELMIAVLLGLLITAGVIQIFVSNRTTYAFTDSLSWIQENARFAVDHISNNTRMAGYVGCLSDVGVINNLGGAANPFRDDLANGLQGFEFNGTGANELYAAGATNPMPLANANAWTPPLPADLTVPARVIPGSDVVVVRYINGAARPLVAPFSTAANLSLAPGHGFQPGQVLVVTDCQKASIFQLTSIAAVAGVENLAHAAGAFVPGNALANWGPVQTYGLGSEVASLETMAFYIGRGQSNTPSLFQLRLQRTGPATSQFLPEELIEGVDSLQARYGVDTDNDQQVDVWQTADVVNGANNWPAVLSVEISLLARAAEEYGTETDTAVYNLGGMRFNPVDDRRLRQVFTTTVGLRNRLP